MPRNGGNDHCERIGRIGAKCRGMREQWNQLVVFVKRSGPAMGQKYREGRLSLTGFVNEVDVGTADRRLENGTT